MRALSDRDEIAALLADDPALHAYELGDLDDAAWPHTAWYATEGAAGHAVVLLYTGGTTPTLLGLTRPDGDAALRSVLADLQPALPGRFEAHLTGSAVAALGTGRAVRDRGPHLKMALSAACPSGVDTSEVEPLRLADADEASALFARSYPGHWFGPHMLHTGHYVGVRRRGRLAAVGGVHAWSPTYRVAALGNIVTAPEWRGRGLASAVTAALCQRLRPTVDTVALNVKADNGPAVACYRRLGFAVVAEYREFTVTAR